jgi:chemotaxis protein MotB
MRGNSDRRGKNEILIRKEEVVEGGHHGGSWKVAYADFVTAMMAFFLLMWLLNATTEEQRKGLADYFSPNSVLSHSSSGIGQPFGGRTAFSDGAMLSDLGTTQVTVGQQPVVDDVQDDGSDVIVQPRPHRDDSKSQAPDLGGRPPPKPLKRMAQSAPPADPTAATVKPPDAAETPRQPTEAELRAAVQRREKEEFERAAQQVRDAVAGDPRLAELARQLAIDMRPEGLRIQIPRTARRCSRLDLRCRTTRRSCCFRRSQLCLRACRRIYRSLATRTRRRMRAPALPTGSSRQIAPTPHDACWSSTVCRNRVSVA